MQQQKEQMAREPSGCRLDQPFCYYICLEHDLQTLQMARAKKNEFSQQRKMHALIKLIHVKSFQSRDKQSHKKSNKKR